MELSIKSSTAGSSIMGLSHTQAGKLASGVPLLGFQVGNPGASYSPLHAALSRATSPLAFRADLF